MEAQALPADQADATERTRLAEKRLATVRAELAFKAVTVHIVHDGYLACKYGYCRSVPTIEALEAFAVQVGARAA